MCVRHVLSIPVSPPATVCSLSSPVVLSLLRRSERLPGGDGDLTVEDLEGTGITPRSADRPTRTATLPPEWTAASAQEAVANAGNSRGEMLGTPGNGHLSCQNMFNVHFTKTMLIGERRAASDRGFHIIITNDMRNIAIIFLFMSEVL